MTICRERTTVIRFDYMMEVTCCIEGFMCEPRAHLSSPGEHVSKLHAHASGEHTYSTLYPSIQHGVRRLAQEKTNLFTPQKCVGASPPRRRRSAVRRCRGKVGHPLPSFVPVLCGHAQAASLYTMLAVRHCSKVHRGSPHRLAYR